MIENEKCFVCLCTNIKKLRKSKNMTQKQLANYLGMSVSLISKLENNVIPPRFTIMDIFKICRFFGIKPKDIFQ